jgi:hypothetical protein
VEGTVLFSLVTHLAFPPQALHSLVLTTKPQVFKQLTGAPEQLRDLKEGLLSVLSSLRLLVEHLTDTQLSHGQVSGLGPTIDRAGNVVSNVEKQLGDVRKGELGIDDLRSSAKGVLVCAGRLEEFHEGLIRYL